ncbi:histidine acid phosphatase [Necator americanus]|uniref:Histidine acid phosphatase n=1 Tax=Necator americanus TaxID=51031 RepID=W2SQT2_NECAM|nr:histidine acid phosphatase [Necator americanus]ETN72099.1 histidine acid phosphatase [Necator americanus]
MVRIKRWKPLQITPSPQSTKPSVDHGSREVEVCCDRRRHIDNVFLALAVPLLFYRPPRMIALMRIDDKKMKLLSAIVLFRHGARAPLEMQNKTIAALFPNGPGEITQAGIEETFNLGRFLGKRYVKTKFLRTPPLPSEVYFRSRSNNRCLFCGAVVGSGMWASDQDSEFTAVPVYSQGKKDKWGAYEGFIYECIGLHYQNNLFPDAEAFSKVETLVQMDRNGLKMPDWFEQNREQIYSLYEKQDWLLLAFLHSLGCGDEALGSTIPTYNSVVIIELYVRKRKPFVKVLYKHGGMTLPRDVTHAVRGCTFSPCHLVEFSLCCKKYMTDDPKSACDLS